MDQRDEKMLVERASGGDMSAFREIVEGFKHQIYSVALDFTGNHHDAEEVLQEVLMKVYRSLHKFRGDARLSTWLHRVTANTCLDRRRRASPPTTSSEEIPLFAERLAAADPGSNPERSAESTRIREHIDTALAALTPLERSVFVLRNYSGLPIKEVARVLGRSEGTVKNMLWRALRKLQKELAFYRRELGLETAR
jgi:RNA polymerase sigma-70 factor (ECF subfamily)